MKMPNGINKGEIQQHPFSKVLVVQPFVMVVGVDLTFFFLFSFSFFFSPLDTWDKGLRGGMFEEVLSDTSEKRKGQIL